MDFESLYLVPLGALAAWGLIVTLRRMRPPEGAPTLGPSGIAIKPEAAGEMMPDAPRWGVLEFGLALLLTLVVATIAANVVRPEEASPAMMLVSSLSQVVALLFVFGFILYFHGQNVLATLLPRVGWSKVLPRFGLLFLLGWPTLIFLVAPLWAALLEAFNLSPEPQPVVQMLAEAEDWALWIAAVISAVFVAAIVEELAFRGLLYVGMRRLIGPVGAAWGTAFLFALVHVNLFAFLPLFVMGLLLAEVYERTRSLAIPILFHAAFNAVTLALLAFAPEWVTEGNGGETPQTQPTGELLLQLFEGLRGLVCA